MQRYLRFVADNWPMLAFMFLQFAQKRGQYQSAKQSSSQHTQRSSAGRREMLKDRRFWFALPTLMAGPFVVTGIFIQQSFVSSKKVGRRRGWQPVLSSTALFIG